MRSVPIADFTKDATELVEAAGGGEEIIITRDGSPVARLLPSQPDDEARLRRAAIMRSIAYREELRAQGVCVTRAEIREAIDEGRP